MPCKCARSKNNVKDKDKNRAVHQKWNINTTKYQQNTRNSTQIK